ncbi:MAG: BamA/TamA family outer membrane protein [Flavobacteriales bacterium]|nr:BamA/TamA family outer membrane protein [Flavobacteriales bacterium]
MSDLKKPGTWLPLLMVLLLAGCRGLRHVTPEDPLFTGSEVVFTVTPEDDPKGAHGELAGVVEPSPNGTFLGMRPRLAIHNMFKEPKVKGKGFRNMMRYKVGESPVHLSALPLTDIDAALVNRMNNRGYFSASASHEVVRKGRKARVVFTVVPGRVHRIASIAHGDTVPSTDTLRENIRLTAPGSLIHAGEAYSLERVRSERDRVVAALRNNGYYHLGKEDLEFAVDTSVGDRLLSLRLRTSLEAEQLDLRRHYIRSVQLHGDMESDAPPLDSVVVDDQLYVSYFGSYRPRTLTRAVSIKPGQPYSLRRTERTQAFLGSYGVFSGVRVEYEEDSLNEGMLDAKVMATPMKRFTLFSDVSLSAKSNNFAGPGLKAGFKDRNLFRGGEQLVVDATGRFEAQVGTQGTTTSYEIVLNAGLRIPRLLLLQGIKIGGSYTPFTNFNANYGFYRRIGLYGMRTSSSTYSYSWRSNARTWHELDVIEVSLNEPYYTSPEFDEFLSENPSIRRSFEEQFIVGTGYSYAHTTQQGRSDSNWWWYGGGIDASGNLLSSVKSFTEGERPDDGYKLFGQVFAQYVRLRAEVRSTQRLGDRGAALAGRFLASSGLSYGNSTVMPYVKQYYSGGPNSVRAFRARSIGPGSYAPPTDQPDNVLVDQVGDIRIEANLEYRFPIAGYVKGALFVDAGNVWLLREDPQRPGAEFEWGDAVDELAVGAGFGIRFDVEVIVLRLDLAMPLRRPDLAAGDRWTFDDLDPQLEDNAILNIAIGYPF